MSILTLGTKILLVNDPTVFPVTSTDTYTMIEGFGTFYRNGVQSPIIASRGIAGQPQKLSVTSTQASQITMGTVTDVNTPVRVVFEITSTQYTAEFARHHLDAGDVKVLHIALQPGDTAATLLQKIHDQIQIERSDDGFDVINSTFASSKLTLTLRDNYLTMRVYVTSDTGYASSVVTKFAPVEDQPAFAGLNNYEHLLTERMFTDVTTAPFGTQGLQLPEKGALYSSISFEHRVVSDDVYTSAKADSYADAQHKYLLFIKEGTTALTTYRNSLITALAAGGATVTYYKGTAAAPQTVVADQAAFSA